MKNISTIFTVLYLLLQNGTHAQQMVQNINDINVLKDNEQQLINQPLKNLLKELKPEIKIAFAYNDPPLFEFRFITSDQRRKKEGNRLSLFVYVQDVIDWKWEERPKGKETIWAQEDAEKYGDLIVTRIGIVY